MLLLEEVKDPILSIYDGAMLPKRMCYLHPNAAKCFSALIEKHNIVLSDMYRSPYASFKRKYPSGSRFGKRRGVAAPGFSAHNFGLAIDVAVDVTLANLKMSKYDFDNLMFCAGFHCHRTDHKRGREDWHYNYLGIYSGLKDGEKTTAPAVERYIRAIYGGDWYSLDVEKHIGDRYTVKDFQKTWLLKPDGIAGPITRRTMWILKQHDRLFR